MAITTDDFNKIWASESPLTPYSFSASQYKEGWNFIGSTPPSRQMWDFLQKNNDEKMQYLLNNFDNYLPLSGGTVTGDLTVTGTLDGTASGNLPLSGGTVSGNLTVEGTITGNLAGNATNATNATNDANGNPIAGTYLPLAGGTMTGSIQYVENGKVFAIGNTEPENVDLGWNLVNREGAGIGLRSAYHKYPGEFSLFARDSANSCALEGKPDGTLTWGDKEVERINTSGSKYIRYENGIQICWGYGSPSSGILSVTFPLPFIDNSFACFGCAVPSAAGSGTGRIVTYSGSNKTPSSIKLTVLNLNGSLAETDVDWFAIGYWK